MSDLSALQPTIFFASCTLKGLVWIPWYLLPEVCLKLLQKKDEEDEELLYSDYADAVAQEEALLLQDHHVVMMERICHYTNILALVGMLSFYGINPRLFQYRNYGWLLLSLLLLQHVPQQLRHEGFWLFTTATTDEVTEDDEYNPTTSATDSNANVNMTTIAQVLQTNRIFSTIGVLIVQGYCLYYGYLATLQRLAAEPLFVYLALMTIFLETHVMAVSVWIYGASHLSTALALIWRQLLCVSLFLALLGAGIFHVQYHKAQAKILRKQLKTINTTPKMKFV